MEQKINEARQFIRTHLAEMKRPALACSFGKDSMTMLALVREQMPEIPVLYMEAIAHPTKHAFAERIAAEWNLNLTRPVPAYRDAVAQGDRIEVIEIHEVAPGQILYFPIEAEEGYIPDENATCGLELVAYQPPPVINLHFDGIFIGHRGDDVDPTFGAIPLKESAMIRGGFRYLYPLRDWTESDIWEASQLLNIPQNEARYKQGDLTANNDYYPLCTECMKVNGEPAYCPKMNLLIPRIGAQLKLGERREFWRSQFVNIEWNASSPPVVSSSSSP